MDTQTNCSTEVKEFLVTLQKSITRKLTNVDGQGSFFFDSWERPQGGGGTSAILQNGQTFESLGVNFSHVYGEKLPPSASAMRPDIAGCDFEAMGISLVGHPKNPYAPTAHLNVRYFCATKPDGSHVWWFGGGYDLTPYYGFHEDAKHFHTTAFNACQPFGDHLYPKFKKWADDYFFLKHRNEPRGIGGIFFDDFNEDGFENAFNFMQSVGSSFTHAYAPIVQKRKDTPYTDRERNFQLYRRGRYVEFNLIFDRGTIFGLQSGGRTESILMSLPPVVNWKYCYAPEPNSPEEQLYTEFLKPKDWLNA